MKWRILPYIIVRHTGFPIDWLEELQFEQVTKHCQEIIEVEKQIKQFSIDLTQLIKDKVTLMNLEQPENAPISVLSKIRRMVKKHKSISISINHDYLLDLEHKVDQWNALLEKKEQLETMGREQLTVDLEEKRKKLWDLMKNSRLREAIWMLNPNMDSALERYVYQYSAKRNSNIKKIEKRLITYLQRLCTKNETNSFFGPIDYASINENAEAPLTYQWIAPTWRKRKTFLSQWAAEEILQQMVRTASSFIKPRRHTIFSQIDEQHLHFPLENREVELTELGEKIFKKADGTHSIQDLSQLLGKSVV